MDEATRRKITFEMGKSIRLITTASLAVTNLQLDLDCTKTNLARAEREGDHRYARILLPHEESEIRMLDTWKSKLVEGQAALIATFAIQSLGRPLPLEILREILLLVIT